MPGEAFKTFRFWRLLYRADNLRVLAGNVRLFGSGPGKGWIIYRYSEQAPGWAMHRRWDFKLFCIHHVGPGKAVDPEGWHVTWARRVECGHCNKRTWRAADNFRTGKP